MSDPRPGAGAGNYLILLSDEHQARALSCAGHFAQTPNLDRLAARGVRFTNAYTPSPICVPARAAFAAGRRVHEIALWDNAMPYTGDPPGWGHALQAEGARVESIGKLHFRDTADAAGFDEEHLPMMVLNGVGMVWGSVRREAERMTSDRPMLGERIGPGESAYTRYDAAVTDAAVDWLAARRPQEGPWCLQVGLVAPHFPLVAPQEFYDLYADMEMPPPKAHPRDGHARHPWVELQNGVMDTEARFVDEGERLTAIRAYFALVSWMDHNVGRILDALDAAGLTQTTTVAYTSDHGDNVGARGLWGKSNMYEESAAIPMILSRPGVASGVCETPVDLLDLSADIAAHFGAARDGMTGRPLREIAAAPPEPERPVFSEYHAVGAVSGAYMLRKGRWKLIWYVGFPPELFDLEADPEELTNRADDPAAAGALAEMEAALRAICDPDAVNARAFADQDALIARVGGVEAALTMGAKGATPAPKVEAAS